MSKTLCITNKLLSLISGVFNDLAVDEEVFLDTVHVNHIGSEIIAERIYQVIFLIEKQRDLRCIYSEFQPIIMIVQQHWSQMVI